ncbi:MAG: hypothetical protein B6U65_02185 [Candidatus Wolframiiraptor sp. EX4484-121]|nr:MAG: hypothetical protein B6U65_02185 [Candidatus Wolframiiraptor sp. EX4484-121]
MLSAEFFDAIRIRGETFSDPSPYPPSGHHYQLSNRNPAFTTVKDPLFGSCKDVRILYRVLHEATTTLNLISFPHKMLMRKVRFAVIGLGWFGEKHAHVLSKLPHAELFAVCSRTESRAREIARRYGAKKWYTSWEKTASDPEIDAVSVVTQIHDHRTPAVLAAEHGKHVFVEKPIAGNLRDADEMIAAAERNNVHLMVGHILRFVSHYAQAKEVIDDGRIGRIVSIYARRNIPREAAVSPLKYGSPILLDAIHDTDIMLWYLGDEVESVYGTWLNASGSPHPDVAWCIYNFRSGAKGVCETVWFLPEKTPFRIDAKMEILGTDGAIYIDCGETGLEVHDREGVKRYDTIHWPIIHGRIVGALKEELSYFAECVLNDKRPEIVTPQEARKALELVLAAERSARSGFPISIK